jgi:transcriptional antiterminator NusG
MAYQWYAIQTYAGSERSVKRAIEQMAIDYGLEAKIENVVVPTEEVIEVKNGEKKITERSLYSGYVFASLAFIAPTCIAYGVYHRNAENNA